MPIYEYRCQSCGQIFDVRQRFSDEPLKTHNGCGGEVDRLISAPALQFKGSGFYITDYAKGGNNPSAKPSSGEKSESKSESKETKTESKADTKKSEVSSASSAKSDKT